MSKLSQPLAEKRIVVTRSARQAGRFRRLLEDYGAREVLEIPTISIVARDFDPSIVEQEWDWLVFTSVNGVRLFFQEVEPDAVRQLSIAVIGPATARKVEEQGLKVTLLPDTFQAEGLLETFGRSEALEGKRILIPRASEAREILPRELRRAGAAVEVLPVYDTVLPAESKDALSDLAGDLPDLLTFTSSSTARNFASLADPYPPIFGIPAAAIGPITADTATEHGFHVVVQPEDSTIPALAKAIAEHFDTE